MSCLCPGRRKKYQSGSFFINVHCVHAPLIETSGGGGPLSTKILSLLPLSKYPSFTFHATQPAFDCLIIPCHALAHGLTRRMAVRSVGGHGVLLNHAGRYYETHKVPWMFVLAYRHGPSGISLIFCPCWTIKLHLLNELERQAEQRRETV